MEPLGTAVERVLPETLMETVIAVAIALGVVVVARVFIFIVRGSRIQ